jgi:tartrate dehydrogenase/decarboxylase / D-malate dehydrogenase
MKHFELAVIPGDGIGQEVMPEALRVLNTLTEATNASRFEYREFPWGCNHYLQYGRMMDEDGLKVLSSFDSILFGAVGYPSVPDHVSLRGLRIPIVQGFDQYICYRPTTLLPGVTSPLCRVTEANLDLVVIRENTEGEYSGAGGRVHHGFRDETATQTTIFTRSGVERVVRYAFELARVRRKHLISATKSNAQQHAFAFWDEIVAQVSEEYKDVRVERVLIDALAARFVLSPESIDVVVASNLFGDILSDLGGALSGSLGLAPSGNINPEHDYPSMFEPVHGSAPAISGKGVANPIAMFLSTAMMLEHLDCTEEAGLLKRAVAEATSSGKLASPDLGGVARTQKVSDTVISTILRLAA